MRDYIGRRVTSPTWGSLRATATDKFKITGQGFHSAFIWTMSYRVDSDVFTPSGNFIPLQCNEEQRDAKIKTSKDAGKANGLLK